MFTNVSKQQHIKVLLITRIVEQISTPYKQFQFAPLKFNSSISEYIYHLLFVAYRQAEKRIQLTKVVRGITFYDTLQQAMDVIIANVTINDENTVFKFIETNDKNGVYRKFNSKIVLLYEDQVINFPRTFDFLAKSILSDSPNLSQPLISFRRQLSLIWTLFIHSLSDIDQHSEMRKLMNIADDSNTSLIARILRYCVYIFENTPTVLSLDVRIDNGSHETFDAVIFGKGQDFISSLNGDLQIRDSDLLLSAVEFKYGDRHFRQELSEQNQNQFDAQLQQLIQQNITQLQKKGNNKNRKHFFVCLMGQNRSTFLCSLFFSALILRKLQLPPTYFQNTNNSEINQLLSEIANTCNIRGRDTNTMTMFPHNQVKQQEVFQKSYLPLIILMSQKLQGY